MKIDKIKGVAVLISLLFLSGILVGCAGSPKNFRKSDYSKVDTVNYNDDKSKRLTTLEDRIAMLDHKVASLDTNVEELRDYVTSDSVNRPALAANINMVEVTSDNIRINGQEVSDEDFIIYLETLQVCDKKSMLIASPKAELKKVTWVVECLYEAGCSDLLVDG